MPEQLATGVVWVTWMTLGSELGSGRREGSEEGGPGRKGSQIRDRGAPLPGMEGTRQRPASKGASRQPASRPRRRLSWATENVWQAPARTAQGQGTTKSHCLELLFRSFFVSSR